MTIDTHDTWRSELCKLFTAAAEVVEGWSDHRSLATSRKLLEVAAIVSTIPHKSLLDLHAEFGSPLRGTFVLKRINETDPQSTLIDLLDDLLRCNLSPSVKKAIGRRNGLSNIDPQTCH